MIELVGFVLAILVLTFRSNALGEAAVHTCALAIGGRTPVREALQQLARDGLVVILPRRGVVPVGN